MSIKRIALISAVAVTAMALVGGGYAAAQNTGESTTLITTPGPETTSQAYRGATTSELTEQQAAQAAAAYPAGCGSAATTNAAGTKITVTVTGSPAPTGSVTLSGYGTPQTVPLVGGQASYTYSNSGVVGETIDWNYPGNGTYGSCSGSIDMKATPTCLTTRDKKVLKITVSGPSGVAAPTGAVTFALHGSDPAAGGSLTTIDGKGVASRTYSDDPKKTEVTYFGDDRYIGCSDKSP